MILNNKDLKKIIIHCFKQKTKEEQETIITFFTEIVTITIIVNDIIQLTRELNEVKKK